MTITLRTTKGSALSFNEMDNNFREILDIRRAHIDQVTAGGTVDVLTADFTAVLSLVNGVMVKVKVPGTNTVAGPTLNVNGTGAKGITGIDGNVVGIGAIPAGSVILFSFDSGNDSWIALNLVSDANTFGGNLPNFYLQATNMLCDEGTIDPDCLPQATPSALGGTRYATSGEVAAGTETQAAVTPATLGAATPTATTFEGTDTITGLTAGKKYLVSVYGVTKDRGNDAGVTLGQCAVVDGLAGSGTIIKGTPTKSIDWPDGSVPQSHTFVITAVTSNIAGVVDRVGTGDFLSSTSMFAVQLN